MKRDEIKEKLIALCFDIFRNSEVKTDLIEYVDFSDDLGMDSIMFITLVVEIEASFAIIIPDDKLLMENFRNIRNVIGIVESELKIKNDGRKSNVKA